MRRLRLERHPDGPDAIEPEGAGGVLVEVPVAPADKRAAVIDGGLDTPAADREGDVCPARQRPVGDAVERVEATRRRTTIVIPGSDVRPGGADAAGRSAGAAVGA